MHGPSCRRSKDGEQIISCGNQEESSTRGQRSFQYAGVGGGMMHGCAANTV